jgi:hypothetical protein
MAELPSIAIYQLRLVLAGISPIMWRRLVKNMREPYRIGNG